VNAIVADTHALLWYLLSPERLSHAAAAAFEQAALSGEAVYVPAISIVEIAYLVEKGRFLEEDWNLLISVLDSPAHRLVVAPLDAGISVAVRHISRVLVPDMPDRIIAATAMDLNLPLVTRDAKKYMRRG
jgi:PIN domain nuclease of toxin-antitoxin system